MKLTIKPLSDGDLAVQSATDDIITILTIPEDAIVALQSHLGQGRDIENVLDPIQVLGIWIEQHLERAWGRPITWEMLTTIPDWMGPDEQDFIQMYRVTPIDLALAQFPQFGGDEHITEVTLREEV